MFTALENQMGYHFKNKQLLAQALTHSSYSNEKNSDVNNERLEFLGDAVLEVTISDLLYKTYPKMSEGELTKLRANIVCESSLHKIADAFQIGRHILLSRGEELTGGRNRGSILSDAVEALIGAVYVDSGFENARGLILTFYGEDLHDIAGHFAARDYKSHLQEVIQRNDASPITYAIVREDGPDHSKIFTARVTHQNAMLGMGMGKTKKEAEQNAAYDALQKIKEL